jgi:hypothetical protein
MDPRMLSSQNERNPKESSRVWETRFRGKEAGPLYSRL